MTVQEIYKVKKYLKKFQSSSMLLIMLIIICLVTLVLSIILFYYLSNSSRQIENLSIEYVKSNSINTVTYIKEILQNKILTVSSNLYVLSSIPHIEQQSLSAISNLEEAQFTTSDLTVEYGWINEREMGLWSTIFSFSLPLSLHSSTSHRFCFIP